MSLATRCPACGTVFRVVQDQLKVSDGWVRCGRCSEVFNAAEGLFDLERDSPPPWAPSGATAAETLDAGAPGSSSAIIAGRPPARTPVTEVDIETGADSRAESAPAFTAAGFETGSSAPIAADTPFRAADEASAANLAEPAGEPDGSDARAVIPGALSSLDFGEPLRAPQAEDDEEPPPGFVRKADRAARWHSPGARSALLTAAVALGVVAVLQSAYGFRDQLAAHAPASRALLGPMCSFIGCRIEAPRELEALAVESSGLVKVEGADLFRLSVVLRNHTPNEVRLPAIDLTLTDARGAIVARKILAPSELGANGASLAGGAELALEGLLDAGGRRLAGYTIDLFYP